MQKEQRDGAGFLQSLFKDLIGTENIRLPFLAMPLPTSFRWSMIRWNQLLLEFWFVSSSSYTYSSTILVWVKWMEWAGVSCPFCRSSFNFLTSAHCTASSMQSPFSRKGFYISLVTMNWLMFLLIQLNLHVVFLGSAFNGGKCPPLYISPNPISCKNLTFRYGDPLMYFEFL